MRLLRGFRGVTLMNGEESEGIGRDLGTENTTLKARHGESLRVE